MANLNRETRKMTKLATIGFVLTTFALAAAAPDSLLLAQETTTRTSVVARAPASTIATTATTTTTTTTTTLNSSNSNSNLPAVSTIYDKIGEAGPAVMHIEEADSTPATASETDPDTLPAIESRSLGPSGDAANSVDGNKVKDKDQSNAELSIDPGYKSEDGPSASDDETELANAEKATRSPSHLNMTQIDELYVKGRRDEHGTVEAWQAVGKKLKKGIGGIIGTIVPLALNMSQEARISSNCSGAMLKWVLSMNQLKGWALRMLDASGKPIAGLLEGSMTMFGNYRQCLKVRAPDEDEIEFAGSFREYFRGKYCIIQAKPWLPEKKRFYNLNTKLAALMESDEANESYDRTIFEELNEWLLAFNFVSIRFDLCVPSLCSREDMQKALNFLLKGIDLKARVSRCEMDRPDGAGKFGLVTSQVETGSGEPASEALLGATDGIDANKTDIRTSEGLFDFGAYSQLGWIILPLIMLTLVVLATLLSLTLGEDEDEDRVGMGSGASYGDLKPNRLMQTIKSLSLKRSIDSHLNVDYDQLADDKPLALYGVRFVLVMWVILVESAINMKFEYLRELMMLKELIFWWPMQIIINSTLQYDSLILLTAFTMGYKNCLNDRVNEAKSLVRFIVDKYVRLMPSVMLMVALVILLPLTYKGPVWNDYVVKQSAVCQSTGWLNSIFLQNYLPYDQICLPQTWLLCIEFQLVLLMAPLVYYLNKSYSSKFDSNSTNNNIIIGSGVTGNGNIVSRQQDLNQKSSASPGRKDGASKSFYWLWTTPGVILAACIVLGLASSFYNVYSNDLPPSWFYTMADPDSKALYFGEHLTKLWTHLAVFAMGILAGVECRRATKNVHRGYRSRNLNFITRSNTLSNYHKSQSTSATSLPTILARQHAGDTNSSSSGCSDQWNANHDPGCDGGNVGSSVSININGNSYHQNHQQKQQQQPGGSCLDNSTTNNICGVGGNGLDENGLTAVDGGCNGSGGGLCSLLLDALGFITAITIMSAIIFSTHDWALNDLPSPLIAGLFDAGSRFLWSLAMIWILFRLSVPNNDRGFSLLAKSLGHPLMVSLGKLSFLIYIIHPFVHTTVLAIQEQPIYSSWLMLFHILIGNITLTVILASLVSLFVEMPCRNLFRRCGTSLLLTQTYDSSGGSTASTNIS